MKILMWVCDENGDTLSERRQLDRWLKARLVEKLTELTKNETDEVKEESESKEEISERPKQSQKRSLEGGSILLFKLLWCYLWPIPGAENGPVKKAKVRIYARVIVSKWRFWHHQPIVVVEAIDVVFSYLFSKQKIPLKANKKPEWQVEQEKIFCTVRSVSKRWKEAADNAMVLWNPRLVINTAIEKKQFHSVVLFCTLKSASGAVVDSTRTTRWNFREKSES